MILGAFWAQKSRDKSRFFAGLSYILSMHREREDGAGDEIRTHDPNLGKVMLYP